LQWLLEKVQDGTLYEQTFFDVPEAVKTKAGMVNNYRDWAKTAQIRGASEFTGAEKFWCSIRGVLNDKIFPGRRIFQNSGGDRRVVLPAKDEMLDGFNRLLGGNVVSDEEEQV
jgi:hypothetical protein